MAEQINASNFIRDFESTLTALDGALNDAIRAVTAIRAFVPQINALAQVVVTVESAVTQARHNIDVGSATPTPSAGPATTQAPLRAVEPAPQVATVAESNEESATPTSASQCVRLQVTKAAGPLDLKNVDNAVNEHPEIVDLALLDYDGRQATLKIWITGSIDLAAWRQSLTDDLRTRVGEDASVTIEFGQESAAA